MLLTLAACENRSMANSAVLSATAAVTSGSAMPRSDPKASKRMTAAMTRPIAIELEGG